jgi:hypothetical protein
MSDLRNVYSSSKPCPLLVKESAMPDFTWAHTYDLLRSRAALQAAFEQLGYQFSVSQPATGRHQRPRAVGETADQRARVELIGPAEVVFKATLMRIHSERNDTLQAHILTDLVDFLTVMLPTYEDRADWLTTHWALVQGEQQAKQRFRDHTIVLRKSGDGKRIVLGVTWQPDETMQEH